MALDDRSIRACRGQSDRHRTLHEPVLDGRPDDRVRTTKQLGGETEVAGGDGRANVRAAYRATGDLERRGNDEGEAITASQLSDRIRGTTAIVAEGRVGGHQPTPEPRSRPDPLGGIGAFGPPE